MRCPSQWIAPVLTGLLIGCSPREEAFQWERQALAAGQVFRHSEWSATVGWQIVGPRPIEIIGVRTSCGCVRADARTQDGQLLTPGRYAPGTRGNVVITVKPKRQPRDLAESVPILWRFEGDGEVQVSDLKLTAEVADAWQVEPAALQFDHVAPGESPMFDVRWRGLVPIVGTPDVAIEGDGARLDVPEVTATPEGRLEIHVRGHLARPAAGHQALALLQLRGMRPPAPDVPLQVTFAHLVEVSPDHVVTLSPQADGQYGAHVRVTVADDVRHGRPFEPRAEVEPASLRPTLAIESVRVSPHEVDLSISCGRDAPLDQRFGTLVIHHGMDPDPPVKLLWYVRS